MKRRWHVPALAAVMGVAAAGGCGESVRTPPEEEGIACVSLADCEAVAGGCRTAVGCEGARCVFEDAPEGTAVACYSGPAGTEGTGMCQAGVQQCDGAGNPVGACVGEVVPAVESCAEPLDEDCDGLVNEEAEGCACLPGTSAPCYSGPAGTAGVGACVMGAASCTEDGLGFEACVGEKLPEVEACDAAGVDEDCDGLVNEEGASCYCGDGYVQAGSGEGCDDGNADSTDLCTVTCEPAACGDGLVQEAAGESCDDGGTSDGDTCSPTCQAQEVLGMAAATHHTCALLSEGAVKCWGNNGGRLGIGDTAHRGDGPGEMGASLPAVDLGSGQAAVALAVEEHTCALLSNGSVKCWGPNFYGQLGLGDGNHRGDGPNEMGDNLPTVDRGSGKTAVALTAGFYYTCAILNDGAVKCWGINDMGQLGSEAPSPDSRGDDPGEMGDNLPAVDLGTGKTAVAIAAKFFHTCVLLNDGSVKCWGANNDGQLGLGAPIFPNGEPGEMGDNLPAVDLGTGKTAVALTLGASHTCALLNDGSVKCWGSNYVGELGLGDTTHRGDEPGEMGDNLPAVDLGTGKTAVAVAAGAHHTCALLNDDTVKCWGYCEFGCLGYGDTFNRGDEPGEMGDNLPAVDLGTGRTAVALTVGGGHTCARLDDGSVKCWGLNINGHLGLGDTLYRGDEPGEMGDALPTVKLFSPLW